MTNIGIAIHGGAGAISKAKISQSKYEEYYQALKKALTVGYKALEKGASSIEGVKEAIVVLEDFPLFNAGKGSVFTNSGEIEMDAALMDGSNLEAGAVAGISLVKNPILLAEAVLKNSSHVLISGEKAVEFAKENKLEIKPKEYFETEKRFEQFQKALAKNKITLDHEEEKNMKFGTVGAVALDRMGNLAAGTSTGGMVNKKYGRIGDSPLIGIGTYANNKSCAISCTGHGEYYIRTVLAHEVSARMIHGGQTLQAASDAVINTVLPAVGGQGGLIGIDKHGNIVMPFNTAGMFRGYKNSSSEETVEMFGQ